MRAWGVHSWYQWSLALSSWVMGCDDKRGWWSGLVLRRLNIIEISYNVVQSTPTIIYLLIKTVYTPPLWRYTALHHIIIIANHHHHTSTTMREYLGKYEGDINFILMLSPLKYKDGRCFEDKILDSIIWDNIPDQTISLSWSIFLPSGNQDISKYGKLNFTPPVL